MTADAYSCGHPATPENTRKQCKSQPCLKCYRDLWAKRGRAIRQKKDAANPLWRVERRLRDNARRKAYNDRSSGNGNV
jgi:hypothetical protein